MKAKTCIKKTLSLIVVLVMLLTMIPVGMISVSAADEAPTIDLSNYDSAEEYVIMNTADWLLIAESDKDFFGITVKLGADIDAGSFTKKGPDGKVMVLHPERFDPENGANMPNRPNGKHPTSGIARARDEFAATFPTLFKNFAGEFDGQGHTIKNARVEEGLIAAIALDGAEIRNVNIVDCQCCDFFDYDDYGLVVGVAKGSLILDGVNVVRGYVPSNTFNTFTFNGGGGLVGLANAEYKLADGEEPVAGAKLTITNCNVEADVHTGGEHNAVADNMHGTGIVVGTVMPNFDFEMTNCNISGNVNTYAFYAGAIGLLHVGESNTAKIENINLDNVNVSASRSHFSWGGITSGALVACISPRNYAQIDISKVNVTNSHVGKRSVGVSGGLIGSIQAYDDKLVGYQYFLQETVTGAEINISNISISDTIVEQFDFGETKKADYSGAGGLIGQIGEGDSATSHPDGGNDYGRIFRGDINIFNCYVGTTVITGWVDNATDRNVQAYDQGAGGLFAFVSAPTAKISVSNMIVDVDFPMNQIMEMTEEGVPFVGDRYAVNSVGIISYAGHTRLGYEESTGVTVVPGFESGEYGPGTDNYYEVYLEVKDVVTTVLEDAYSVVHLNRKGGIHYNGVDIGCGDLMGNQPYTDEAIQKVRPATAQQMVQRDEKGFVEAISIVNAADVQASAVADNKVDIRFVGTAALATVEAGATVTVKDAAGTVVKTFTFADLDLYDKLGAIDGTAIDAYTTKISGANKLMAVTVTNVPVGTEYTVECNFSYTTAGGTASGSTLVGTLKADGSFAIGK